MEALPSNKVTISRSEFLESFVQLYHAIKDYDELINLVSGNKTLDPKDIRKIIQSRINQLEFGSVNVKAMEILGTYLRFTLEKFKGDKLTFLIPDNLNDDFFSLNDGFLDVSKTIQKVEEDLREVEEKVYYLVRLLPPHNVDKIRLLLKTIASFFKSIVRRDFDDMDNHINHMHHLTANKESYFVINDIGRMVRDIHNSLQDFSSHVKVEEMEPNLVDEMPDAIDKLNLVIKRMEESANSTLDNAESLIEKNNKKIETNKELINKCGKIISQLKSVKESHPESSAELDEVIGTVEDELIMSLEKRDRMLKDDEGILFDIIAAQSFQDITGQTLKKIIDFIEQLEFNLLQILQKYSGRTVGTFPEVGSPQELSPLVGKETNDGIVLYGPQDNKEARKEIAKQDDVDKVLAEFGF
ncbi:MAG: protein phosphatase CheZ [Proteobacteria bacterium]|nr:protein phosphatase CheZ [Pseudomonadota bacterium]